MNNGVHWTSRVLNLNTLIQTELLSENLVIGTAYNPSHEKCSKSNIKLFFLSLTSLKIESFLLVQLQSLENVYLLLVA